MGWNESSNQDPWGNNKKKSGGPPDLDEALKQFKKQINQLFGGKAKPAGPNSSGNNGYTLGILGLLFLLVWALSGIFIVQPAERAVVLRFGKYHDTLGPGPHWIPRFIDAKTIVNVEQVENLKYSDAMLNKDENIISATVAVQYRIGDPKDYLFNVIAPRESLKQATASSLRQVIGHTTLDDVLTVGREQVRQDVAVLLKEILARYKTGIVITDVAMLPITAPEEVKAAFDDAIKAQEDEKRFKNQAKAYTAKIEPKARGEASKILQQAEGYREKTILRAKGDVARFLQLLPEYEKAPIVTRERLYLDAMSGVLSQTSKILVDTKGSNNLLYLPLESLIGKAQSPPQLAATAPPFTPIQSTQTSSTRTGRESYRGRGEY